MSLKTNLRSLSEKIEKLSPAEALGFLCDLFPGKVVFSTSLGQEDQVITQLIAENNLAVHIFFFGYRKAVSGNVGSDRKN
jgi:phosphoadenosine phosphosulfate reductase